MEERGLTQRCSRPPSAYGLQQRLNANVARVGGIAFNGTINAITFCG
jgi:hypothetical protein